MKKLLAILLSLLLLLTACTPRPQPITPPEPQPPVTEVTPDPEPEPLGYTVGQTTKNAQYDGLLVNITLPVLTGENQAALDVINHYYELLAGKVLDYAEGDLIPQQDLGITYEVIANYDLTYATENTVSILWQVTTVTTAESPAVFTRSAAVFDVKTGNLILLTDLFGENTETVRAKVITSWQKLISEDKNGMFYERAHDMAASAFDPDNFFLLPGYIAFFYAPGVLSDEGAEVNWTYEELGDLLVMEP